MVRDEVEADDTRVLVVPREPPPATEGRSLDEVLTERLGLLAAFAADITGGGGAGTPATVLPGVPGAAGGAVAGVDEAEAPLFLSWLGDVLPPPSIEYLPAVFALLIDEGLLDPDRASARGLVAKGGTLAVPAPRLSPAVVPVLPRPANGADHSTGQGWVGAGVRLGIVDTGVDPYAGAAEQLAARLVGFQGFGARSGRRWGAMPPRDNDPALHGTIVAALACGTVSGVAPGVELSVAAAIDGRRQSSIKAMANGLDWLVVTARCDVVNVSASIRDGTRTERDAFAHAVANYVSLGSVVVVAAAGNTGVVSLPGNLPEVITVGAALPGDRAWPHSASAPVIAKPEMAAVAANIDCMGAARSGTSYASPLVAGACAVLASKEGTAPAVMRSRLRQLVRPAGPDPRLGWGILDLTRLQ